MQNNTFPGLFFGQNIITLQRVDSTNNYLKSALSNSEPIAPGTVIMAENQFAGRGQFNNRWLSTPGKNLTFSILLSPDFLSPDNTFILNIAVSIAINEVLRKIIGNDCKIKWPNDILYKNGKLGGILIENIIRAGKIKHAIVGIGINVNQTIFPQPGKQTSLTRICQHSFNRKVLLKRLCQAIERRFLELQARKAHTHLKLYYQHLFGLSETRKFIVNGFELEGVIKGLNDDGCLLVNIDGELRSFGFKEISYVL